MRLRHSVVFASSSLLVLGLASVGFADTGYTVTLDATQEVPPNASPGTGFGTLVVNNAQTQVSYSINFCNLSAPRTASHIHAPAPPGTNAGVAVTLAGPAATCGTLVGVAALNATIAGHMMNGQAYVNIHTSNFPGGEIRGQIRPDVTPTKSTTWGRLKKLYR